MTEQFDRYTIDNDKSQLTIRQLIYRGLQDSSHKIHSVGDQAKDHIKYCDWPGERLFETVSFEINGHTLDEYNDYSYVYNRQFKITADSMAGYMKAVGQDMGI